MSIYDGDIKLDMTSGEGAITMRNGQPVMDAGFSTAVNISLFGDTEWWGGNIGGEFWSVCESATLTNETRQLAEDAARRDLQWMLDEGIAERLDISASIIAITALGLAVAIYEPEKETPTTLKYRVNWNAQRTYMQEVA